MNSTVKELKTGIVKRVSFYRTATIEDIKWLSKADLAILIERFKLAPLYVDPDSFQPYQVIDGIRYLIEAIMDAHAKDKRLS